MKSKSIAVVALLVFTLPLAACSTAMRQPRWLHPGPVGFQRDNALQFDPYPLNDVGPEIVGGRPRGFQKPPNEITRARQQNPLGAWRTPGPVLPTTPLPTGPLPTGPLPTGPLPAGALPVGPLSAAPLY